MGDCGLWGGAGEPEELLGAVHLLPQAQQGLLAAAEDFLRQAS